MSNIKFYYKNLIDSSNGYLVSSENLQYPVTNLFDPRTTKEVRGQLGQTTLNIIVDLGNAQPVDSVIFSANALEGWGFDSVILYGDTDSAFTSPAFTSSTLTVDHKWKIGKLEFSEQTYRFWKMSFTGGGDYTSVSNVFLGKYTQMSTNNIDYGWTYVDEDQSDVSTNRWGTRFVDRKGTIRKIDFNINAMDKTEYDVVIGLHDEVGTYKPFWVMVDDSETIVNEKERFAGYFYLNGVGRTSNPAFSLYNIDLNLVECV